MPVQKVHQRGIEKTESNHQYAGFVVRAAAAVIDGVVVAGLNILLAVTIVLAAFGWATWWVYSILMLVNMDGATLGKKLFGIKVVAGTPKIGYGTALLREIVGKFLSSLVFGLGYLWVIWDPEKQGWHDKVASTHVVHLTPFGGGRKAMAWVICGILILGLCLVPLMIGFGMLTLGSYLGRNSDNINQSIMQLKSLEKSNQELQNNLEQLKDLQKQLETSPGGAAGQ